MVFIKLTNNEADMYTAPTVQGKKFRRTVKTNLQRKAMVYCGEVGVIGTSCEVVDEEGDRIDAFVYTDYNDTLNRT